MGSQPNAKHRGGGQDRAGGVGLGHILEHLGKDKACVQPGARLKLMENQLRQFEEVKTEHMVGLINKP